jgi:DNA polymerase-3 subunit epsilon
MNFTAVDVETAQGPRHSICQIGIVTVVNGEIIKRVSQLVQPPGNIYSYWNTQIHGIHPETTTNSPLFPDVWNSLKTLFDGQLLVAHNAAFDSDCLKKALHYYKMEIPEFTFDCTYKRSGLKLNLLCQKLNIDLLNHHDALSDAEACAKAYIKIIQNKDSGFSKPAPVLKKDIPVKKVTTADVVKADTVNGNFLNQFYHKKLVFAGIFQTISRADAAESAKKLGATVLTMVTAETDFIIAGEHPDPSKLMKATMYNKDGANIRILSEEQFKELFLDK